MTSCVPLRSRTTSSCGRAPTGRTAVRAVREKVATPRTLSGGSSVLRGRDSPICTSRGHGDRSPGASAPARRGSRTTMVPRSVGRPADRHLGPGRAKDRGRTGRCPARRGRGVSPCGRRSHRRGRRRWAAAESGLSAIRPTRGGWRRPEPSPTALWRRPGPDVRVNIRE